MKAESSQIPINGIKSGSQTYVPRNGTATLWAEIRRIKARVLQLELAASTARRDINRIDRKQYRDDGKNPPSALVAGKENDVLSGFPAELFGGR